MISRYPRFLLALVAAVLTGCASAPPQPLTIVDVKYVAVTADKDLFRIEKAPEPVKKEDIQGKDKNGQLMILSKKIIDLYGYIGNLQSQILGIQEEQEKIAERIEKGNKK